MFLQRSIILFNWLGHHVLLLCKPVTNYKVYNYTASLCMKEIRMMKFFHCMIYTYVTGFWNTNQIVTLGLFQFIGPVNGYTCTVHIHSTITRLGWLVCFSRASFADPVNSWLRQWDLWRVLHGRHGSEIHPSDRETSLTPYQHVWVYGWHFKRLTASQTVLTEGLTHLRLSTHSSTHPTPPPLKCPPLPSVILQWFWKIAQNSVV